MGDDLHRRSKSWKIRSLPLAAAAEATGGGGGNGRLAIGGAEATPGGCKPPIVAFGIGDRSLEKSSPIEKRDRSGSAPPALPGGSAGMAAASLPPRALARGA